MVAAVQEYCADNRRESGRIVDQFIFDDAAKITNLRAFYDLGGFEESKED